MEDEYANLTPAEVNFIEMCQNPFGKELSQGLSSYGSFPRPGACGPRDPITTVAYAQTTVTVEADKPILVFPAIKYVGASDYRPIMCVAVGDGVNSSLFGASTVTEVVAEGTTIPGVSTSTVVEFNSIGLKVNSDSPPDDIGGTFYAGETDTVLMDGASGAAGNMVTDSAATMVAKAFNDMPKQAKDGITIRTAARAGDGYPLPGHSVVVDGNSGYADDGSASGNNFWRRPYIIIYGTKAGMTLKIDCVMHMQTYPTSEANMIARHPYCPLVHPEEVRMAVASGPVVVSGNSFKSFLRALKKRLVKPTVGAARKGAKLAKKGAKVVPPLISWLANLKL